LFLEEFDFKNDYLPGKSNVKADLLSRRCDYANGIPASGKTLLPPSLFATQILVPTQTPDILHSTVLGTDIDLATDWPSAILHFIETHEWLPLPEQYKRKCLSELPWFTVKASLLFRFLGDKILCALRWTE
jgi:hypothetical protein